MISRTDLTDLMDAAPVVGVSLYLPTQTHGRETRQNPIMLKNLLAQARAQLAARGLDGADAETFLAPAVALVEDHDFWQHQDHGLALFLSDAGLLRYKLPMPVPEVAITGTGFHIAPLLPLFEPDADFVILTMTADAAQVWRATRHMMTAITVPALPASLDSLDEAPDYEGSLQSGGYGRPNTGGRDMSKTQVYGDSPEEWRKGRLVEYARRAGTALAAHLARDPLRVVVVADAEIGGQILKDEALAPLIAGFSEVNPAALDKAGLHAAACAVMQPVHDAAKDAALAHLGAMIGRADGTSQTDPAAVIMAAQEGRVDQLFLSAEAILRSGGSPDPGSESVADADPDELRDLLDRAAQSTLRNGGTVWTVAQARLPEGRALCAALRY